MPIANPHSMRRNQPSPNRQQPSPKPITPLRERLIKLKSTHLGPSAQDLLEEVEETQQAFEARNPRPLLTPSTSILSGAKPPPSTSTPRPTFPRTRETTIQPSTPTRILFQEQPNPPTQDLDVETINFPSTVYKPSYAQPPWQVRHYRLLKGIRHYTNIITTWFRRSIVLSRLTQALLWPFKQPVWSSRASDDGFIMVQPSPLPDYSRLTVHSLRLDKWEDLEDVLNILRKGDGIVLLDISKYHSNLEMLKRAINKIKHTQESIAGDLVGIGDSWIVITASGIKIDRTSIQEKPNNPYAGGKASRPGRMSWENFEKWNAERKNQPDTPIEIY